MKTKFCIAVLTVAVFGISNVSAQSKKDAHAGHNHAKAEKAEVKTADVATYACAMKCEGDKTYAKAGDCPKCDMSLTTQNTKVAAKTFACPMKCEGNKTCTKAGDCPKCGMAVVEQKAMMDKKEAKKKNSHHEHNH